MLETSLFSGAYVSQKIRTAHGRYVDRTGDELVADPCDVRDRAERYVRRVMKCRPGGDPSHEVVAGTYAGLMIYASDHYGFNYLYIARNTSKTTADMVAALSGDCRLDLGPQRKEIQTRVSLWSPVIQAVRFAEIVTTGLHLRRIASPTWLRRQARWGGHNHYELQAWTDHAAVLIAGMGDGLFAGGRMHTVRDRADSLLNDLYSRTRSRKLARDRREVLVGAEEMEEVDAFS